MEQFESDEANFVKDLSTHVAIANLAVEAILKEPVDDHLKERLQRIQLALKAASGLLRHRRSALSKTGNDNSNKDYRID